MTHKLKLPALKVYTIDQKNWTTAVNYVIIQRINLQLHVSNTWTIVVLMGIINIENGGLIGDTFR